MDRRARFRVAGTGTAASGFLCSERERPFRAASDAQYLPQREGSREILTRGAKKHRKYS